MTAFQPFEMERMMSKWENVVQYNLSESGVHPVTVRELIDDPGIVKELLATELHCGSTSPLSIPERLPTTYWSRLGAPRPT